LESDGTRAVSVPDDGEVRPLALERRNRIPRRERYSQPEGAANRFGPDFLCIGVQKAATTWLHRNLNTHPDVFLAPIKEVQYFSSLYLARSGEDQWQSYRNRQIEAAKLRLTKVGPRRAEEAEARQQSLHALEDGKLDDERYCGLFAGRRVDQIAGEISPAYALLPRVGIRHVLSINPRMKFLVMLRDPAARLVSSLLMSAGKHATSERVWEMLRGKPAERFAQASDYATWLRRWFGLAGRENFHLEYQGDVGKQPLAVLERVCGFLGIAFVESDFHKAEQEVFSSRRTDEDVEAMRAFIRERFANLYDALDRDFPDIAERLRKTG
jgi:hypothetical protein